MLIKYGCKIDALNEKYEYIRPIWLYIHSVTTYAMVFITVGKQTEDRFLIVHEDSIRSTEDGAQLDGTALAFVLDRNDEFASDPMPIDSIIAHGHGM